MFKNIKSSITSQRFLILLVILLVESFSINCFAQNKKVSESCEKNEDCESGYCVKLKNGQVVCLYCSQSQYDTYWNAVQEKCKNYPEGYFSVSSYKSELEKSINKQSEVSLVTLYSKRENCYECYRARRERENNCWKDKIDSGHQDAINVMEKALEIIDGLINQSKRNKLAYSVDEGTYEDLLEDEEEDCKGLQEMFKKYGVKNDDTVDCDDIEDLIEKCIDCRAIREDIVEVFKEGVSDYRLKMLNEVKEMEKQAKEVLEYKKNKNLCK